MSPGEVVNDKNTWTMKFCVQPTPAETAVLLANSCVPALSLPSSLRSKTAEVQGKADEINRNWLILSLSRGT